MFKTKAEYLTWRSQWRADYAALTHKIRNYKAARKGGTSRERAIAQCWCHLLRQKASAKLEDRKQSKLLAQQGYLAAKTAAAAAATA